MGVTLTQHPGLARAVVSAVGIYDMIRYELDPNGAFNVAEYGTVKDPNSSARSCLLTLSSCGGGHGLSGGADGDGGQ
jgi:prolyl oligopeptidase PreP (S9A serine peptidase family)